MIIKVTKTLILNLFYDKVEANRIYFTNSFSSDYIPQKKNNGANFELASRQQRWRWGDWR